MNDLLPRFIAPRDEYSREYRLFGYRTPADIELEKRIADDSPVTTGTIQAGAITTARILVIDITAEELSIDETPLVQNSELETET